MFSFLSVCCRPMSSSCCMICVCWWLTSLTLANIGAKFVNVPYCRSTLSHFNTLILTLNASLAEIAFYLHSFDDANHVGISVAILRSPGVVHPKYARRVLKSYDSLRSSQYYLLLLQIVRQCPGSIAGILEVREESPGSTRRSTSENGSCRRRQV